MTIPIDASTVVTRNRDHISSQLDDELVIMNITSGKYYGLDSIAGQIWRMLIQPKRVSDICALLQEEYEVATDQCLSDILALLTRMRREKLIMVTPREP